MPEGAYLRAKRICARSSTTTPSLPIEVVAMTNLAVFAFEGQQVRFVGTADQPQWVAQDVCQCLELNDISKALEPLEADEKDTKIVRNPRRLTANADCN